MCVALSLQLLSVAKFPFGGSLYLMHFKQYEFQIVYAYGNKQKNVVLFLNFKFIKFSVKS